MSSAGLEAIRRRTVGRTRWSETVGAKTERHGNSSYIIAYRRDYGTALHLVGRAGVRAESHRAAAESGTDCLQETGAGGRKGVPGSKATGVLMWVVKTIIMKARRSGGARAGPDLWICPALSHPASGIRRLLLRTGRWWPSPAGARALWGAGGCVGNAPSGVVCPASSTCLHRLVFSQRPCCGVRGSRTMFPARMSLEQACIVLQVLLSVVGL